jgi:NAD(P)-dependent dehydrogenase (short-subunit alcohol dehydrogenase family)
VLDYSIHKKKSITVIMSSTPKYLNKLQGKRILIFGGTSGIGYAVAEAAVEFGATIIISGSNTEKLDKTVARLKESYPDLKDNRISTVACDLSKAEQLDSSIAQLFEKITNGGANKIDHITFSAGNQTPPVALQDVTLPAIYEKFNVRLFGPLFIAKYISQST